MKQCMDQNAATLANMVTFSMETSTGTANIIAYGQEMCQLVNVRTNKY